MRKYLFLALFSIFFIPSAFADFACSDTVLFSKSWNLLELYEPLDDIYSTITTIEFCPLEQGTLTTSHGTTTFDQYIRFDEQPETILAPYVLFGQEAPLTDVHDWLFISEGTTLQDSFFEYNLELRPGLISAVVHDVPVEFIGQELNFVGEPYTLTDARLSGDTVTLTFTNADGEIILTDDYTDTSFTQAGATIDGILIPLSFVKIKATFDSTTNLFTFIDLRYRVALDQDLFIAPSEGLGNAFHDPLVLLGRRWDIQYGGLFPVNTSDIIFSPSGDDEYNLQFENNDGLLYKFPYLTNEGGKFKFGDNDDDLVLYEGKINQSASQISDHVFNVGILDYFVLTATDPYPLNTNASSHVLRYNSIDTSNRQLQFDDDVLGHIKIFYEPYTVDGILGKAEIVLDDVSYAVYIANGSTGASMTSPSIGNDNPLAIDFNGDGVIDRTSSLVVAKGGAIFNATSAIELADGSIVSPPRNVTDGGILYTVPYTNPSDDWGVWSNTPQFTLNHTGATKVIQSLITLGNKFNEFDEYDSSFYNETKQFTFEEGETHTEEVATKLFEIELLIVSDTNPATATFKINDEVTPGLAVGDTYVLVDNSTITIDEIILNEGGEAGFADIVTFSLHAEYFDAPDPLQDSEIVDIGIGKRTGNRIGISQITGVSLYQQDDDNYYGMTNYGVYVNLFDPEGTDNAETLVVEYPEVQRTANVSLTYRVMDTTAPEATLFFDSHSSSEPFTVEGSDNIDSSVDIAMKEIPLWNGYTHRIYSLVDDFANALDVSLLYQQGKEVTTVQLLHLTYTEGEEQASYAVSSNIFSYDESVKKHTSRQAFVYMPLFEVTVDYLKKKDQSIVIEFSPGNSSELSYEGFVSLQLHTNKGELSYTLL